MSISSLLRILWRHPLVVGSVALLSLLAMLGLVLEKPPTYRAGAAVVLLNPPAVPTATATRPDIPAQYQNPYVRFGDLSVVVDILVRITGSQEVVNSLKSKGLEGTFTIAANRDFYRGPIVDVAAESTSSEAAISDTKLVIKEIQDELVALQTQQGTDPAYFIRAELVVGADRATTVFSGTLRLLIVAGGLGAILTVAAGLVADAIERRRLTAAKVSDEEEDDDEPGLDPVADDPDDPVAAGPVGDEAPVSAGPGRNSKGRGRGKGQRKPGVNAPTTGANPTSAKRPTAGAQRGPANSSAAKPSQAAPISEALTGTLPEYRKALIDQRKSPRLADGEQRSVSGSASIPDQRKQPRRAADAMVPDEQDQPR